jgi:energy-converting hydrogenase Eha subunit C
VEQLQVLVLPLLQGGLDRGAGDELLDAALVERLLREVSTYSTCVHYLMRTRNHCVRGKP